MHRGEDLVVDRDQLRPFPKTAGILRTDVIRLVGHVDTEDMKSIRKKGRSAPMHPEHDDNRSWPLADECACPPHVEFHALETMRLIGVRWQIFPPAHELSALAASR